MINIEIIKKMERYEDFAYLNKPVNFKDYFKDRSFDAVQIHDIRPIDNDPSIVWGFVGAFSWHNNIIKSLDGDSYHADMNVYGYSEFTFKEHGEEMLGIEILVDRW